jgi:hypothetical protein
VSYLLALGAPKELVVGFQLKEKYLITRKKV